MSDRSAKPGEIGPNNLAIGQSADDDRQTLLELAPRAADSGPADRGMARRQKRDGLRTDVRRTAEYLALRGKTPTEVAHDLVKLGAIEGPRVIKTQLGVTMGEAIAYWQFLFRELLPYTAHRLEPLDAGAAAGAAGVAGGMAAMHFLAATAAGDRILATRGESPINRIGDSRNTSVLTGTLESGTVANDSTPRVVVLPPIAED